MIPQYVTYFSRISRKPSYFYCKENRLELCDRSFSLLFNKRKNMKKNIKPEWKPVSIFWSL